MNATSTSSTSTTVCAECRQPVDPDASTCPHCGYRPADELERYAKRNATAGVVLSLLILTLPIGAYLL